MRILILIAITILAVGCGGKDESTTETKPVEEKVLEVKEEVKPEELVAETNPELEGVNKKELEPREDIVYLKGSDTPYTGKVYGLHENGQKQFEGNFKTGKKVGLVVGWHENGQKSQEGNFKDGKQDGLTTSWHKNGQKKFEGNFKAGKRDGLYVEWYPNGKKNQEVNYKDGKYDGLYTSRHENGQKQFEGNFKTGKKVGLVVGWHENGQKSYEANFKDGKRISEKFWNSTGEPVDSEEEAK